MMTRPIFALSTALFFMPVIAAFAAGEHPSAPQQPPSQQLSQGGGVSSRSAVQTMEASQADIAAGLKQYIDSSARKSADKRFHLRYGGKDLALELIKIHDGRFSSLGRNKYFACVDMKGADGKVYDIDFLMAVQGRTLNITETSVHKINGKPLYNWKEEKGVWKKCVSCRDESGSSAPN
jgi:hypothetical protein